MSEAKRNLRAGTHDLNRSRLTQPFIKLILAAVLLSACMTTGAPAQFSGGSGTVIDPYLISVPNDLQAIGLNSSHWNKHFKLTADLDLTGVAMTPIGTQAMPFAGSFDGGEQTIANLTINLPTTVFVGLCGVVNSAFDPTIFNLGLIDPNITGDLDVGALAGQLFRAYPNNP